MASLSRKQVVLLIAAITIFGFLLRVYHFSDWLHFELDQARDARVIDRAVNGDFFDLPLQGPKAGGTPLRLGPVFYYFQYVSALLFGATPSGIAVIVMLLSVASIPIFFLFARRLFSDKPSVVLTLLFASSTFLVLYGRFAWNPNPIPFFVLLGMYALLRAVDREEMKKGFWLSVSAFGLTLATQLHFLAFVALPVIAGAFLLFRRPRISWKGWVSAIGMVIFLYTPVILNDIATGGRNAEEFLKAVTKKSESEHSIFYKGYKNISENALGYLVVLSGYEGGAFPEWQRVIGDELAFVCDSGCKRGTIPTVFLMCGVVCAIVYGAWKYVRGSESRKQSDALLLCGLWFSVSFLLFLPIATSIAPRFFLLVAPLPFLLLGLFVESLRHTMRRGNVGYRLGIVLVCLLIFGNLWFLSHRFDELAHAGVKSVRNVPDRILKERIRVTLEQQNQILDFMESESKRMGGYPIYMYSEPQHRRALKYLLERRGLENDVLGLSGVYREGLYYLIIRTKSDHNDAIKKYLATYDMVREVKFGTLVVIEFSPKKDLDIPERQIFGPNIPGTDSNDKNPRYTWREFFLRQGAQTEDESE